MAGIGHINSAYNPELKRLSSKLAFQIGEQFSARVVKFDVSAGEILLKLLDGWHFTAKLDKPLDFSPKGQLKFQIVGMEDGQVVIRLLQGESSASKAELDSLLDILKQNNLGEESYDLLEKMLKHEIPLNKENISKMKSITDFVQKITADPIEEDLFIGKYLLSKAVEPNSEDGQFIKSKLKDFFSQLKSIDTDDILTMFENDIELNSDNIESFKRIFKTESGLYNNLKKVDEFIKSQFSKELADGLSENIMPIEKDSSSNAGNNQKLGGGDTSSEKNIIQNKSMNNIDVYTNATSSNTKLNKIELLKTMLNEDADMSTIFKDINLNEKTDVNKQSVNENTNSKNIHIDENVNLNSKELHLNKNVNSKDVKLNENTYKKDAMTNNGVSKQDDSIENTLGINSKVEIKEALQAKGILDGQGEASIKNLVNDKTQELKEVVKNIFTLKNGVDKEVFDKVLDLIKPTINDIKVFNTVNNQYYYMDIPLNLKEQDYPCKLIIKDERNRGKKIDSKNVNMVISIKTVNMGDIDSFIKVRDNNMSVDIKCNDPWIKTFENSRDKLINNLKETGYNLFVNFEKREAELDISSCRNFFNDSSFNNINIKV